MLVSLKTVEGLITLNPKNVAFLRTKKKAISVEKKIPGKKMKDKEIDITIITFIGRNEVECIESLKDAEKIINSGLALAGESVKTKN